MRAIASSTVAPRNKGCDESPEKGALLSCQYLQYVTVGCPSQRYLLYLQFASVVPKITLRLSGAHHDAATWLRFDVQLRAA